MRIESIQQQGPSIWVVGLVGIHSDKFKRVTLTEADLAQFQILEQTQSFSGNPRSLKLGIQAYSLGIAHEFDPYFGLSLSRVDPLPHQLEAVYDYLLKLARVRFLLADDAGAGKTIMAGLLLRELKLRGLVERILIVCPANLAFQWQREMKDKFDEKFRWMRTGRDIQSDYGVNPWQENEQFIVSMDLVRYKHFRPALQQCKWDLVIIDEAHRMSASRADHKTLRYQLGELLRDTSDHILLLTATPHKGDPENFTLFLQLLDRDVYANVKSIEAAIARRRAPFYLRRTKEMMVYFPQRQPGGSWAATKIFTKRITSTADFFIDGIEFDLYRDVSRFVKEQCRKAAAQGDERRARAVGFLMSLYQRRLASSTYALRRSLEKRAKRLQDKLNRAQEVAEEGDPYIPSEDEWEELEDAEREALESKLEALSLSRDPTFVQEEIEALKVLAEQAKVVEGSVAEAKLSKLKELLVTEGFFDRRDQRLLIFTEFKDTLDYLMDNLKHWGFEVGCIHGGMKPGSRDEPGTRLHSEQEFKEGKIQILVATEAAGEGINLQVCNILFNYDLPWNPMRLEQRMGRIHRYGQRKDCLIFNFVTTNTIEGRVLKRLLARLEEIRNALEDDTVFNVVGEVLPAAQIERVLRDYYSGKLGAEDLEERLLKNVKEEKFRAICKTALEGLVAKQLNLDMLVERKARAQERRMVPETIARFILDSGTQASMALKPIKAFKHSFHPFKTPPVLKRYESQPDWTLPPLATRYPRFSTDRNLADTQNFEWVTPGHPLFEALRRHTLAEAQKPFSQGATFYALDRDRPARLDLYRARVVDGLDHTIHERLFVVEVGEGSEPVKREVGVLGDLQPARPPDPLPPVANLPEPTGWFHEKMLAPFLDEVRKERQEEVQRIADHVEISLTELIGKEDALIGRFQEEVEMGVEGAAGNLAQAVDRHSQLLARREKRRRELEQQRSLTLQKVERLTSALVLPHPERDEPRVRRLRPDPATEATAMGVAMEYEAARGRKVFDVHEQNLGYDLTSLDTRKGELRLIEVKGLKRSDGDIYLTPNEHRVAEDRRDCYWLYVVTDCGTDEPRLTALKDPLARDWKPVTKLDHYELRASQLRKGKDAGRNEAGR